MKKMLVVLLTLICMLGTSACENDSELEKIVWDDIVLKEYLPEPQSKNIELISNDEKWLCINVKKYLKMSVMNTYHGVRMIIYLMLMLKTTKHLYLHIIKKDIIYQLFIWRMRVC